MAKAELNIDLIATVAGDITVYNYDDKTREYLSSAVEYLAVGVGIPAHSTIDRPLAEKKGKAICRNVDSSGWEYVTDHRGEIVYRTKTGESFKVTALGDYPEGITIKAPSTPYDKWDGEKWVVDEDAKHADDVYAAEQKKAALLAEAQEIINIWQMELQLGIISDNDKASLIGWLAYIKQLNAANTSIGAGVEWPTPPASPAR